MTTATAAAAALPLRVLADLLTERGEYTPLRTLERWASSGLTVRGERVRLEASRRAGRWYSSLAAVESFHRACERAARGEAV
jgi:hypothetical protein